MHRRWRARRPSGVAEIIGAILLVALTIIAGMILWTFQVTTPPAPPVANFHFRSGGSAPVWGDPTDCQPWGNWTYPLSTSLYTLWAQEWQSECSSNVAGDFSPMNVSELIFASVSPSNLLLSDITLTFLCDGRYAPAPYTSQNTTVLVSGSLAAMTWFPGSTSSPAANAPTLGWCGGFQASGYRGGAFGVLYNRLGIFIPIAHGTNVLRAGDTFQLYLHEGGWPMDYSCVDSSLPLFRSLCSNINAHMMPIFDFDDYHGAPPWCFTSTQACTIDVTYTGNPSTVLASIPVTDLSPPTEA